MLFSSRSLRPRLRGLFAGFVLAAAAQPALADRPFIATTSAAAEEDDDRVWSFSLVAQQDRTQRAHTLTAEYAFEPLLSVEFSLQRQRVRDAGTQLQAETEFKWLFNHIARDGWGAGLSLALGGTREDGEAWRGGAWELRVPFSWQWSADGGLLHLNLGLAREPGQSREVVRNLAAQFPLGRRWLAFAEWARSGENTLQQAGVRWWVKRERTALDLSVTRRPGNTAGDGRAALGWALSFSVYDL